jgi:hypothetical protein
LVDTAGAKAVHQTYLYKHRSRQKFLETNDPDALKDLPEIPSPDEFLPFIELAIDSIKARLIKAGQDYGEQVLFNLAEFGAVSLCYTKASRMLWSFKKGNPQEDREDSFLDLAGYAILEMARQRYIRERENEYGSVDEIFKKHDACLDSEDVDSMIETLRHREEPGC